jgi:hypothetical protein
VLAATTTFTPLWARLLLLGLALLMLALLLLLGLPRRCSCGLDWATGVRLPLLLLEVPANPRINASLAAAATTAA